MQSPTDEFEKRIQHLAAAFQYPETPDLATVWRSGAETGRTVTRLQPARLVRIGLVVLLMISAFLLLVPNVRAAVLEFLQIGGLRIQLQTPTAAEGSSQESSLPDLTPTDTAIPSLFLEFNLSGETSLEQAQAAWGDPILLPGPESGLGPPDRVYLQQQNGLILILTWSNPNEPQHLLASLIILKPGVIISKTSPDSYEQVQVRGQDGLWLQGEHYLILERAADSSDKILVQVLGNVLVWEDQSTTYRLESYFDLEQSKAIAASMVAYPK